MTHFISTQSSPAACPRCQRPTLTAHDEGVPARVDAQPLPDAAAEVAALIQGLRTYTHTSNKHLIHRDAHRIAAGTLRGTIHAEHKCTGPQQQLLFEI